MNLNILTSGLITSKLGIRPALMCATDKDISKHSVIRIVSDAASGWIGIAYGHLITGAKSQNDAETLSGFEALAKLVKLETGVFDLIQLESRLLGDELAQSIGISIDDLIREMDANPDIPSIDLLRKCKKVQDAVAILMSTEASAPPMVLTHESEDDEDDDADEWNLGDEDVIESLQKQAKMLPAVIESGSPKTELVTTDYAPSTELQSRADFEQVSGFVLLREDGEQFSDPTAKDRLGTGVRAELHEFVKSKFGVEGKKFFEEVDLEENKDYQASLVLRDLESAIEKSKVDLNASSAFQQLAESVEIMRKVERIEEQQEQSSTGGLRNLPWVKTQTGEFARITKPQSGEHDKPSRRNSAEINRPSSAELDRIGTTMSRKGELEQEASRDIFTEQVRKSTEVDTKTFLATSVADVTEIEETHLKEKHWRSVILATAGICMLVSGIVMIVFLSQRHVSLDSASDKLTAGDLDGARLSYEQIIHADPGNWRAYIGHALSVPNDYKAQIKDFDKVLELQPHDFASALAMGNAYFELKDYRNSFVAAERAALIERTNVPALQLKAMSLIHLGEFEDASKVLDVALGFHPKNKGEINYLLSTCFREMKNPQKQEYYLHKAIEIDPKNPTYLKELAMLMYLQHNFSGAKDQLNKAIALSPGDGELHYKLAQLLMKENLTDKAIEELTKAIEHGHADADSLGQRGILFFVKQRYGDAKADLEEALGKNSEDEDVRRTLEKTDKAIEVAARAKVGTRQLPDTNPPAALPVNELKGDYVGKAYSQLKAGNSEYAARVLTAAVRANPNDVKARRYLASALYANGDWAESASQFGYAGAVQPLDSEEMLTYGRALSKAGRMEQAIKVLENLVATQPTYKQAKISLIKAYSLAGFRDHARELSQQGMQQAQNQAEYNEFKSLSP